MEVNQATHVTEMDKAEHEKMFMDKVFKEVADEASLLIIMEATRNWYTTLQKFIVILLCKSIKVIGEMYKVMVGKLFCKNYLEI